MFIYRQEIFLIKLYKKNVSYIDKKIHIITKLVLYHLYF